MRLVRAPLNSINELRTAYLNSLPEFQELFLELMIESAEIFIFQSNGKDVGYAVKTKENILIEFYVMDEYIPESYYCFEQIIKELSISNIYCKTFDALLLSNCLLHNLAYEVLGILYRDYVKPSIGQDLSIQMIRADLSSVELLKNQDDSIKELFETDDQLIAFIQKQNVFEFYKNEEFIGCGMVLLTNPDWDYCDLGVWVHPTKRGSYVGSQILLYMRDFALKNNMKPSCGCAIENIASQKVIEKSGFVSKHKMIDFKNET